MIVIDRGKVRTDARDATVDRPPRRQRLPARAHAGRPTSWRSGMCADFIEPDLVADQGRRARRPARERDLRHHRRRRPPRVRRPARRPRPSTARASPAGSPRTSPSPSSRPCAPRSGCPQSGRHNTAFDGQLRDPDLRRGARPAPGTRSTCDGRPVGVYPETKHPTYFDSIGLPLEEPLLAALHAQRPDRPRARRSFIQSFETGNLRQLDRDDRPPAGPADRLLRRAVRPRRPPATRAPTPTWPRRPGCAGSRAYADGVGPCKDVMIPRDADGTLGCAPTAVIRDAHRAGLIVHA